MNQLDFAMTLIRAPYLKKLLDRTFQSTLMAFFGAVGACIAAWRTEGIPVSDKVNLTIAAITAAGVVIAAWNHGEKTKDAAIATAAIAASNPTPNTVNAGGDVTVTNDKSTPAAPFSVEPSEDGAPIDEEEIHQPSA